MTRKIVLIAGLFGFTHSPLAAHLQSIIDVAQGTEVVACDYDAPACLLPHAQSDELIVVAHSFGVARLFRDSHMLSAMPCKLRAFCIDGVRAWDDNEAISTKPNPLAQLGRRAFFPLPNMIEVHSWRRHIDPISAMFPLALSSPIMNATDSEVIDGMDALTLLGAAFGGPAGATVAQLVGGAIGHNSIVGAVMPLILQRIAEIVKS